MTSTKKRQARFDPLTCIRILLLIELGSLFVSTTLTVVIEIVVFICFLLSAETRRRALLLRKQPLAVMTLVFFCLIVAGMGYGPGEWAEKIDLFGGWRKLLLLPICLAVFDDPVWKRRLVWVVVGMGLLGATLSFGGHFLQMGIYKYVPGIVVHNHATQGMFFAVAAFAAVVALRFVPPPAPAARYALMAAAAILVSNILFITPGRSGYLLLLVLAMTVGVTFTRGWLRYGMVLAVPAVFGVFLAVSPVAKNRILQGVHEMQSYSESETFTSMGIRVVMWKNTIKLIGRRPFVGAGTGGFDAAYREQVAGIPGWQGEPVGDPHNQFMRIMAEYGLVGLLIFLAFIGAFFRQPVTGAVRIMGLGVLLAWCATSMFSAHFSTFEEGRFIYLWCGGMLAAMPGCSRGGPGEMEPEDFQAAEAH